MNNFDTLLNERFDSPNKLDEAILGNLKKAAGSAIRTVGSAAAGAVQGAQAAKAGGATRKRDIVKGALGGASKSIARKVAARKFGAKRADVTAKRASQKLNRPGAAKPILGRQGQAAEAKPKPKPEPKVVGGATTATNCKKSLSKTE